MGDAPADPHAALQTVAIVEQSAHDVADSAALMLRTLEVSLQACCTQGCTEHAVTLTAGPSRARRRAERHQGARVYSLW